MEGAPRFVIGIDLGTSNSAVSYADLEEVRSAGRPLIHEFEVHHVTFSPDSGQFLTTSRDGTACMWDGWIGGPSRQTLAHEGGVRYAEFSADST